MTCGAKRASKTWFVRIVHMVNHEALDKEYNKLNCIVESTERLIWLSRVRLELNGHASVE